MATYVRFERGRDDVIGPTFGPFDYVQLTYAGLRIPDDGRDPEIAFIEKDGDWHLTDHALTLRPVSPGNGVPGETVYSDIVIFDGSEAK